MRILAPLLLLSAVAMPDTSFGAQCTFANWFEFKGTKLYKNSSNSAYMYATDHSRIDADGAPNAYHPADVGKNCIKDVHLGLDCPANAGYPKTSWWDQVLVRDPANASRAFIQPSGATKGYFVAKTWLTGGNALHATNPGKYVDSTRVPYVVFPGSQYPVLPGTGRQGDIGVAWHTGNGRRVAFVVADKGGGNDARLGEGSMALYEALGGSNINARTGAGVAKGTVRYVVFPHSSKSIDYRNSWPITSAFLENTAKQLLNMIGGESAISDCANLPH